MTNKTKNYAVWQELNVFHSVYIQSTAHTYKYCMALFIASHLLYFVLYATITRLDQNMSTFSVLQNPKYLPSLLKGLNDISNKCGRLEIDNFFNVFVA